ncbi:adhesion G-protein coupled receptor G7-like [Ictalurus furcatus]|uniref:adhesion G-protein coupled receptor G7-like n=1 Tax=Ictalurus furcatus TaxID=66913 RepID=UPI002350C175|nr:adhesion G-protein coupled receptor G7-like [Ictalurus furcatus]
MMDRFLLILASVMALSGNYVTSPNTTSTNTTSTTTTLMTTSLMTTTSTTTMSMTTTSMTTTSMTTTSTDTTPTFLQCQNGGRETNGFCLCPNDFTGNFCQLSGFPMATALCLNNTYSFTTPQELDCEQTLNTINNDLSYDHPTAMEELASKTQILTSKPDKLTVQDISAAANIVNRLLSKSNSEENNQNVPVAAVTTVSQLLTASTKQFDHITTDSITNLTKTLQKFSLKWDKGSPLVQPNIAIQSIKVTQTLNSLLGYTT